MWIETDDQLCAQIEGGEDWWTGVDTSQLVERVWTCAWSVWKHNFSEWWHGFVVLLIKHRVKPVDLNDSSTTKDTENEIACII